MYATSDLLGCEGLWLEIKDLANWETVGVVLLPKMIPGLLQISGHQSNI